MDRWEMDIPPPDVSRPVFECLGRFPPGQYQNPKQRQASAELHVKTTPRLKSLPLSLLYTMKLARRAGSTSARWMVRSTCAAHNERSSCARRASSSSQLHRVNGVLNTCNVQRRSYSSHFYKAQQLTAITLSKSTQLLSCTRCQLTQLTTNILH